MIKAEIFDQKIKLDTENVVSDSVKFIKIKFFLDEAWNSAVKTAVFKNEELNVSAAVIFEEGNELYLGDNTCYIPFEVIKPPCFSVSISGIKGETLITTLPEEIKVYKGGDISADEPDSYTPSQYEQLVGIYDEIKNIAQSVRNDADNGVFNGKDGVDGKNLVVDQNFTPQSVNAQSGKAITQAVAGVKSYSDNLYAGAIKLSASGKAISVKDVSSVKHNLKMKVINFKNHFDITKVTEQDTDNGTVTIGENETLTITPKVAGTYQILGKLTDICSTVKGGDTITLSYKVGNVYNALGLKYTNLDYFVADNNICSAESSTGFTVTAKLPNDLSDVYVYFSGDLSTHILSEIKFTNGETEAMSNIKLFKSGKNILDVANAPMLHTNPNDKIYDYVRTETGFETTVVRDINEKCWATHGYCIGKTEDLMGKTITVSADYSTTITGSMQTIYAYAFCKESGYAGNSADPKVLLGSASKTNTLTFTVDNKATQPYIMVWFHLMANAPSAVVGDVTELSNIQVEIGNTATDYESFKELSFVLLMQMK